MNPSAADQIVTETFLDVRAKLLEIAATLDRVDRCLDESGDPLGSVAPASGRLGSVANDQQEKLREGIRILLSEGPDRAARLQHLFSRPYQADWRETMKV
ncbi:hypothetical protein [Stieleria varia]|nr:hypothetical protein [Stieleria varia]